MADAGFLPAFLHAEEEMPVRFQQLIQAGEDLVHRAVVQLQLFLHALPEDLRHDEQGLDVVHFRLHQL